MHRMVRRAGPQLMLGQAMKHGQSQTLTFAKPGVYRFDTQVRPMPGMPEVAIWLRQQPTPDGDGS